MRLKCSYQAFGSLCGPSPITVLIRSVKLFAQIIRRFPDNVIVLPCIKMDLIKHIFAAGEKYRDIEAMGKPGFVINTAAGTVLLPKGKIRHDKT